MPRTTREAERLYQVFETDEYLEAIGPLFFNPAKTDFRGAVIGDPERCVLAKFARRIYGSRGIVVFQSSVYLDLKDEKGGRVVYRFKVGRGARAAIDQFDGGDGFPDAGFWLEPHPVSDHRDVKTARATTRWASLSPEEKLASSRKYSKLRERGTSSLHVRRRTLAEAAS